MLHCYLAGCDLEALRLLVQTWLPYLEADGTGG
jgi:hypothetical protein